MTDMTMTDATILLSKVGTPPPRERDRMGAGRKRRFALP